MDEFDYVRDNYFPTADIFLAHSHESAPSGTWNILNSIKQGYETGAKYILLVEEDVRVFPDYFDWTFAQMETGLYAATCGRRDRGFYPVFPDLYTNPGSCLRWDTVEKLIPHINPEYFSRLRGYLDDQFGIWEEHSDLDDGLIRRVIKSSGGLCRYPTLEEGAKVAHQGFHFYNTLDIYKNDGTIEERIQGLRQILKRTKPSDRYARDLEI